MDSSRECPRREDGRSSTPGGPRGDDSSPSPRVQNSSMDLGYDKSFRLLTLADFKNLKIKSRTVRSRNFLAHFTARREGNTQKTRLGISVSKKTANAVGRNKIKRHIREFFRLSPFKYLGKDVLIVASRNLSARLHDTDFSSLVARDLKNLFERIRPHRREL